MTSTLSSTHSNPPHPAKFSDPIVDLLASLLLDNPDRPDGLVLDPMAGVGKLAVGGFIYGDIEFEWVQQCPPPRKLVHDATHLPFRDSSVGVVFTSPVYGNRMSDRYAGDAKNSRRYTYRIFLGHEPHPGSAATLQWGRKYRRLHTAAWREVYRVLRPGGWFILNVSDHFRAGRVQPVSAWHRFELSRVGFNLASAWEVATPRIGDGANRELRVDHENVYLFTKGEAHATETQR